jgi:hypothetical protein
LSFQAFTQELAATRLRGDQFTRRAREAVEGEALPPEAQASVEAERDHHRELFELAPVAYLVTDRDRRLHLPRGRLDRRPVERPALAAARPGDPGQPDPGVLSAPVAPRNRKLVVGQRLITHPRCAGRMPG